MTMQDTRRPADPALDALDTRILGEVAEMLREVIGEEYVVDMEITMDTSFNEDLELESIEFVTLADRMRVTYGDMVDFVGFLAEMDVDRVINMRVGEVVRFIADSLRAHEPAPGA
ncbi:acyl carrier protein [Frankia sp. CNm7]|uniref:Acyl carrier protein n=1 Tax=Frankia nepalensis TaxID=1836974 RepID=A0A937RI88_9ACTN|nr:acyl carrier protein [Frankia nepalensis]MBL7494743.1 acyl carrier protein [Frankia nepalensis]MBL7516225.1 acyl carrier protein [Frankia nepalensis]MBL7519911.1 acyl carrier protein [Frankia nepalensis]MBL7626858.1 acyl carrier protein [Frankia nepalensis]